MTYTDRENSVKLGRPIEAFKFVGTFKTYRYTSHEKAVTFFSEVYDPTQITRDSLTTGDQSQDNLELVIEVPTSLELVKDYAFNISPPDLDLTIYRCHEGLDFSTDPIVFWQGKVTSFTTDDTDLTKIRVPSILETILSSTIPNFYYQTPCNHTLFDPRCGISKVANTFTTTVTDVTGNFITVADDQNIDNFLNGGIISIPSRNDRRLIISNVANLITIGFQFADIRVGDTVELTTGCNRAFSTCTTKFSNTRNFGGFPFIPRDNPFVGEL